MKVRIFERTQIVQRPADEMFRFFSDPRNLERLTPDFLHFKFLSTPPEAVAPGSIIDYQIRLYGVPVHWKTRIELVEPPHRFIDVQEKGPYALWRHTHTFRAINGGTETGGGATEVSGGATEVSGGATEVKDRVEYAMPFGPLGEIAYRLFVARSLEQIFDYRRRELAAIMNS